MFSCYIKNKKKNKNKQKSKLGVQVSLLFKIFQHERDKELMKSFTDYLNCGNISKDTTSSLSSWIDYTVVIYDDLVFKFTPFFDKYKIIRVRIKLKDYLD